MTKIPFKRFGLMLDMSRNSVMNIPALEEMITLMGEMGYNTLFLYTEDTYEIPEEPYFGYHRGRFSQDEIRHVVAFCEKNGIEAIPCIQTLAHLDAVFYQKRFDSIHDHGNILLAGCEESYDLIRKMLKSVKDTYKTNLVHLGMDEAHMLGRGKYLDKFGYEDRQVILRRHLKRVCQMVKEEGLQPIIWSDMFFCPANGGNYYPEKPKIPPKEDLDFPEGLAITYWDYYTTSVGRYRRLMRAHKKMNPNTWFAGGIWCWKGFAPDNHFSLPSVRSAVEAAKKEGMENVMFALWQDAGGECSRFGVLPCIFAAARFAQGETSLKKIEAEFNQRFSVPFRAFFHLDLSWGNRDTDYAKCVFNPEKYLFFNDPFTGRFDSTLEGWESEFYKKCARKLAPYTKDATFGKIFASQRYLALALSYKVDLGVRARGAYKAGDKEEMKKISRDFALAARHTKSFVRALREMWLWENKPQGLELQETRAGGVHLRLLCCRQKLLDWIEKDAPVEELEEEMLDMKGGEREIHPGHFFTANTWTSFVTSNQI